MNNYNSLGAVIAGVNGSPIHRLAQTRSLVNETVHKNFMRLELLMGTHKSHFAYRLALENTTTEHIPFIPLHRRDLVSADEGNRSFMEDGNMINWRKFELMGDILLTMTKSQEAPHHDLRPNATTYQLLFDATNSMSDDVSEEIPEKVMNKHDTNELLATYGRFLRTLGTKRRH